MVINLKKQYEKIITGALAFTFNTLGANLLFSRLKNQYKSDASVANLTKCVSEVDTFVKKYESILTNDLDKLSKM